MSMISDIPLNKLVAAIAKGDDAMISSVKGIGSKTAQRVIIELKEKVAKAYSIELSGEVSEISKEDPLLKDAISALITLGYSPGEARQAVKNAGISQGERSIEEVIKKALKATAGPQVYRQGPQAVS
jgi:Holliday junction DNA helicase RuvA